MNILPTFDSNENLYEKCFFGKLTFNRHEQEEIKHQESQAYRNRQQAGGEETLGRKQQRLQDPESSSSHLLESRTLPLHLQAQVQEDEEAPVQVQEE